jgi:hypothetical protein
MDIFSCAKLNFITLIVGGVDTGKFLVYLGLLLGAREVYNKISVMGRQIAQLIGEQIIEINSN